MSLSLAAQGCTLRSATVEGTDMDEGARGGKADLGFARVDTSAEGVVAGLVLSRIGDATLPSGSILKVQVDPPSSCGQCTIDFQDGIVAAGQPGANVVVAQGRSWLPKADPVSVTACP